VEISHKYNQVIKGFAAKLTRNQLKQVRNNALVKLVEQDQLVHLAQTNCPIQIGADWGLVRISKRDIELDGIYRYPANGGKDVDAYIFDTGIRVTHQDFGGRAKFGFKSDDTWPSDDDNGHGTFVASNVGGTLYGVAKSVTLFAVKVLAGNGSGSIANIIKGLDWAVANKKTRNRPSVGNMSIGGGRSEIFNLAVNSASDNGVYICTASGGSNADACNFSPASATNVITAGASDVGADEHDNPVDVRASFSSFGKCVSLFAPGANIVGAWIGSDTAQRTLSGSSMSTAFVAGIAALTLNDNPTFTFALLKSNVTASATQGNMDLRCGNSQVCQDTPNLLAYSNCVN